MSQTEYQRRVTIAVPELDITDANQLALCTGPSQADDKTFKTASYQDASGNLYALASTVVTLNYKTLATSPLEAPEHSPDADVEAASRAQSIVVLEDRTEGDPPVIAGPDRIAVIIDDRLASAQEHIAALGLTAVPSEETL